MFARSAFRVTLIMFIMAFAGIAHGQENFQKYFSDVATKVKATNDPSQKREILNKSFERMSKAMNEVQNSPLISKNDKIAINRFRDNLKEKQDELEGLNGFERVPDEQLNAFADYVVQDMEQAEQMVTISLVALLLIIIIVILIA